jgi:hypothetical protein
MANCATQAHKDWSMQMILLILILMLTYSRTPYLLPHHCLTLASLCEDSILEIKHLLQISTQDFSFSIIQFPSAIYPHIQDD